MLKCSMSDSRQLIRIYTSHSDSSSLCLWNASNFEHSERNWVCTAETPNKEVEALLSDSLFPCVYMLLFQHNDKYFILSIFTLEFVFLLYFITI